jgi:heme/copper-type cytochrome/quinol oxidase subunit 3
MTATTGGGGMTGDEGVGVLPVLSETPEEIAYELRASSGALWTGTRLVIGIAAFAFASLAFAYFYLRSTNSDNLWRPPVVTAPTAIGGAVFAFTAATVALMGLGWRKLRQGNETDFQVAGWLAVSSGLLAVGLQIWELTRLPFFPGSSGYASCFVAWAAMNTAMLLSGIYWSETLLARSLRLRRAAGHEGGAAHSSLPAAGHFREGVEGSAYYWGFVFLTATFFWVLFYLV